MFPPQMKCFLVLFAVAAVAVAYPDGAPENTCGDMLPQHGKPAQNSSSPYLIKLSKSSIRAGEKVYGKWNLTWATLIIFSIHFYFTI
jgi:hypothetical protein